MSVQADSETRAWTNWSGNQRADTATYLQPKTEDDVRAALATAEGPVRVVGSGHSFTPIVSTTGTILNLDHMGGVIEADRPGQRARVAAGGRLRDLSPELERHDLAFRNLGDINVQSFAGAASTATHGTGETFQCLAAEIRAIKLMTGSGDIVDASIETDPDLIHAAQVSLGALGIILEAEINLQPVYKLHRRTWPESLEDIIAQAPARWAKHRNYEFFYIPFSGHGINISHDETDAEDTPREASSDEDELGGLLHLRNKLKWSNRLRRAALGPAVKRSKPENVVGTSWQLLANERNTPFNEMEYHLPPDAAFDALQAVIEYIEKERPDVFFPIEVRKTAGDNAWLSPFQNGPRISVAVHAHAPDDHDWFFGKVEAIFREAGGRPHWGKLHSLGAGELSALYPDFSRFTALRREMDPDGTFMTPALAQLWGEG